LLLGKATTPRCGVAACGPAAAGLVTIFLSGAAARRTPQRDVTLRATPPRIGTVTHGFLV